MIKQRLITKISYKGVILHHRCNLLESILGISVVNKNCGFKALNGNLIEIRLRQTLVSPLQHFNCSILCIGGSHWIWL
jgi:hypothetical protein